MSATRREEIEQLTAIEGRAPGTDAERRAARHLEHRLQDLGRETKVEALDVWPFWPVTYAALALVGIVGSVVGVSSPIVGSALVVLAVVLTFGDASGMFPLTRRLFGRRVSQNVISTEDGGKPGTLVLVAHYDAGRTGAVFGSRVQERRAAISDLLHFQIGPLDLFFLCLLAVLVCCVVRLLGVDTEGLTVVQFVPTVLLIFSVPLFVDIALSGAVPGANDNASGVATALRLADHFGGRLEHFDVWVLLTGSQEAFARGMRAFLRRHRKELDRESTVFLNFDEVGAGTVRYTRREGLLLTARSHVQLRELCEELAEDDPETGARPVTSRAPSDGWAGRSRGYPAITLTCRNALDYVPRHHQEDDVPDRLDEGALEDAFVFASGLVERLDAVIGPDLDREEEPEEAAA